MLITTDQLLAKLDYYGFDYTIKIGAVVRVYPQVKIEEKELAPIFRWIEAHHVALEHDPMWGQYSDEHDQWAIIPWSDEWDMWY